MKTNFDMSTLESLLIPDVGGTIANEFLFFRKKDGKKNEKSEYQIALDQLNAEYNPQIKTVTSTLITKINTYPDPPKKEDTQLTDTVIKQVRTLAAQILKKAMMSPEWKSCLNVCETYAKKYDLLCQKYRGDDPEFKPFKFKMSVEEATPKEVSFEYAGNDSSTAFADVFEGIFRKAFRAFPNMKVSINSGDGDEGCIYVKLI